MNVLKYTFFGIWRIFGLLCLATIFAGIGYVIYLLSQDIWSLLSAIDWVAAMPIIIYLAIFFGVAALVILSAGHTAEWLEGVYKGWRNKKTTGV